MQNAAEAEIYFITAMMVLILVISSLAVFFFIRQYRKEMRDKAERRRERPEKGPDRSEQAGQGET